MDNEVLVHCPTCGNPFMIAVKIETVTNGYSSILFTFKNERVDHKCQARG